jgi:hypothetical protein
MNEEMNATPIVTIEEMQGRLEEARLTIEARDRVIEMANESLVKWRKLFEGVKAMVQEEFDDNGEEWEGNAFFENLTDYLDIERTEETEIEIVARWYVSVTHPKGMNLGDISVDINSEPDLDGDNCEFGDVQFQETEVNEL